MLVSYLQDEEAPQQFKLLAIEYKDILRNQVRIFCSKGINRPVNYSYIGIYKGLFNYPLEHYTFYPSHATFPEYS